MRVRQSRCGDPSMVSQSQLLLQLGSSSDEHGDAGGWYSEKKAQMRTCSCSEEGAPGLPILLLTGIQRHALTMYRTRAVLCIAHGVRRKGEMTAGSAPVRRGDDQDCRLVPSDFSHQRLWAKAGGSGVSVAC